MVNITRHLWMGLRRPAVYGAGEVARNNMEVYKVSLDFDFFEQPVALATYRPQGIECVFVLEVGVFMAGT